MARSTRVTREIVFARRATTAPSGMTLIELLIVVAIISLLVQMLIPAVQAAREAARRTTCHSHLRQLGLAALAHEAAWGRLPPGGFGSNWAGDPDGGHDQQQPGGWIFAILPYVEEQAVYGLGKGLDGAHKRERLSQMTQTPLPLLNCPSRREAVLYEQPDFGWKPGNYDIRGKAAKSDYAANAGDYIDFSHGGPLTVPELEDYAWYREPGDERRVTGVVTRRAALRLVRITDGLSRTYFAGEKSLDVTSYSRGYQGGGDDQNMYVGFDEDVNRWTTEGTRVLLPVRDQVNVQESRSFGSAHPAGCGFVFCDGSVHLISYEVDPEVQRCLGNRRDGQTSLALDE